MSDTYLPGQIEAKWQRKWEQEGLFRATIEGDQPKYYCLDFFPYPSGEGLHVGHCRNYVPTDVISRYKRMRGFNVLHPMGWDSFAEPTEQFAISHGIHPRLSTDRNTANFRRQMTLIGAGYDWSREIDSSKPEFYRWTQWFFTRMFRRGLAYRDTNWQWWCPGCMTTLSSHEVSNGVCWRGHTGVTKREIPAWYFRITAYADELLSGLEQIDWPESIKAQQRYWIGRSEGCEIVFKTEDGETLAVFTTRPDTVYGVTYFVLAPEHPLVAHLTTPEQGAQVEHYIESAISRGEIERQAETEEQDGVFTGGYVVNPMNGERVPAWIADYVLPDYGTGAVMGVPAHDPRDFKFARRYGLPVRTVVVPSEEDSGWKVTTEAFTDMGRLVESGPFTGLSSEVAIRRIGEILAQHGTGGPRVMYRMHDWLISRQRYWGTPIPIVYCRDCGEVPVPDEQLPVLLPPMVDFAPDGSGRSPLAHLPEFVHTTCPTCGGPAERETDTMGGFACSSWYFLRFTSPNYHQGPFEPAEMKYWMPVDLYVGGAEHAVLHLLYARFWTKVLADEGLLPFREPFSRLMNQGQLLAPDGRRMSKSRGNVITPDEVVAEYGADALRIYEMFMAPFEQDVAWTTEGINGASRFLNRVWSLYDSTPSRGTVSTDRDAELDRATHQTIRHVTDRIEGFRFNTMISALMEFANLLAERERSGAAGTASYREALEVLLALLAPAAPHITEELWERAGYEGSVHRQPWPAWDEALAREDTVEIPVQINGKLRAVLVVAVDEARDEVEAQALADSNVRQHLDGQPISRLIYVPGKIINIVT